MTQEQVSALYLLVVQTTNHWWQQGTDPIQSSSCLCNEMRLAFLLYIFDSYCYPLAKNLWRLSPTFRTESKSWAWISKDPPLLLDPTSDPLLNTGFPPLVLKDLCFPTSTPHCPSPELLSHPSQPEGSRSHAIAWVVTFVTYSPKESICISLLHKTICTCAYITLNIFYIIQGEL